MTKERFAEILREYGYSEDLITDLWKTRPSDDLDEEDLRETAVVVMADAKRRVQHGA